MIGLEYILNLFGIQHMELAERLGIKKQNINLWIKGKQSIPCKYLPMLSEIFKVPKEYFQRELSEVDKLELQKNKLKEDLKPVIVGYETQLTLGENADLIQTPIYSISEINNIETEIEKAKILEKFRCIIAASKDDAELMMFKQIIMLLEFHKGDSVFKHTIEGLSHYYNVLPNWVGEPESDKFVNDFLSFARSCDL